MSHTRPALPALLAALSSLTAFPDPSFTGVTGGREAVAADVSACAYGSNFSMTPGVFGPLADQGLDYARNKVLEDARNLGANTVVFDKVAPGADVYRVTATAYRC